MNPLLQSSARLLHLALQQVQPAPLLLKPHLHARGAHALALGRAGGVAALERHGILLAAAWAGFNLLRLTSRPGGGCGGGAAAAAGYRAVAKNYVFLY